MQLTIPLRAEQMSHFVTDVYQNKMVVHLRQESAGFKARAEAAESRVASADAAHREVWNLPGLGVVLVHKSMHAMCVCVCVTP